LECMSVGLRGSCRDALEASLACREFVTARSVSFLSSLLLCMRHGYDDARCCFSTERCRTSTKRARANSPLQALGLLTEHSAERFHPDRSMRRSRAAGLLVCLVDECALALRRDRQVRARVHLCFHRKAKNSSPGNCTREVCMNLCLRCLLFRPCAMQLYLEQRSHASRPETPIASGVHHGRTSRGHPWAHHSTRHE
jgi:hypothetical protein